MPQPSNNYLESCHYCLGLLLDKKNVSNRSEIINDLTKQGIGSVFITHSQCLRMKYYKEKYGYDEKKYVNASRISDGMIALPVGPHLDS